MRNTKLLPIVLIVAVALILIVAALLPKGPTITVLHNTELKETVYSLKDRSLSLTAHDTELNIDILHLRSNSELPLKEQVASISRILKKVPK